MIIEYCSTEEQSASRHHHLLYAKTYSAHLNNKHIQNEASRIVARATHTCTQHSIKFFTFAIFITVQDLRYMHILFDLRYDFRCSLCAAVYLRAFVVFIRPVLFFLYLFIENCRMCKIPIKIPFQLHLVCI